MVNSISFPTPQAYSGGADFSMLANLGNVYKKAQEDARQQAALANLGQGQQADTQSLLGSGVLPLVQLGLSMQDKDITRQREDARYSVTDARANAQLDIQKAAARRAQETYDKADTDEAEAAKLISRFGAAPSAARPFPAPLPGPQPAVPPQAMPQQAPVADATPSAFGASPPLPATLQAPPVKAEGGDEPSLPEWANPVTARIASNLTSGQPAAAAGLSRDQLAELYRNPITRPIATAFLQKQLDPGTWSYHFDDKNGRVIGTNSRTNEVRDVTPGGAAPMSEQEREMEGYRKGAIALGASPEQARAIALNKGKSPSEDLRPHEQAQVEKLTEAAAVANRVLENVNEERGISKKAWGFRGAENLSGIATSVLPNFAARASGAVDTQDLVNAAHSNVVNVAKSFFGSRISNLDVNLLKDLESAPSQSDETRQKIYTRADKVFSQLRAEDLANAEAVRSKKFYKPGGGDAALEAGQKARTDAIARAPAGSLPPGVEAPTVAKPSLGDFMKRARDANPGASDRELAEYWKREYGG